MTELIAPHGGLSKPVCCTVPDSDIEAFTEAAGQMKQVPLTAADLSTVYRFGDGTLSPLTGPMNEAEFNRVLDECVIENDGQLYAWTIPFSFPVTAELASTLSSDETVALVSPAGDIVGTLEIEDIFVWDKPRYLKAVYGTDRTDHPGADMVLKGDADMTHLLGGRINALPQPKNADFGQYVLTPSEVRETLSSHGWDAVVAFQTRNPLHRAHENRGDPPKGGKSRYSSHPRHRSR